MMAELNMNKLCRTCMAKDKDLISIFVYEKSTDDSFRCFADIIGNLTNTMPKKSDGLSELVCFPCSNEIKKIHSFKMKCINSECILRKILEQTDKEKGVHSSDSVITINKLPDQTVEHEEKNYKQSSYSSEFVIIKSEEHSDNEEKQTNLMVDNKSIETHQNLQMEVIVKEELSLSSWPGQNCEIEAELKEVKTDANDEKQTSPEPDLYESYSENSLSDVEPQTNTNEQNDIISEPEFCEAYSPESDVEPETNTNENENECQQTNKKGKSDLKCPKCQKLFIHLARLKGHIKNDTCVARNPSKEKLVFTCSICGKNYNHPFSLQRHSMINHKQKLTKETIKESSKGIQKEKIKDSINKEVISIAAMRQCNRCKEVFEDDKALALHKNMAQYKKHHLMEKKHICNICHKAFSFSHNLKIHIMNHKKIKPFKCEQCNQTFVRNSCLTRHLKTHTGDRPFTCEFCHKGFPYMYALKIHERCHNEERPYSCSICSRRFKFRNTLKEHQRTHTGEKPFACKLCPRKLSSKSNFRIHMRSHEKEQGISVEKLITDSEKEKR